MVIEDFIPKSNEELINKLNNKFFKGEFYLENNNQRHYQLYLL